MRTSSGVRPKAAVSSGSKVRTSLGKKTGEATVQIEGGQEKVGSASEEVIKQASSVVELPTQVFPFQVNEQDDHLLYWETPPSWWIDAMDALENAADLQLTKAPELQTNITDELMEIEAPPDVSVTLERWEVLAAMLLLRALDSVMLDVQPYQALRYGRNTPILTIGLPSQPRYSMGMRKSRSLSPDKLEQFITAPKDSAPEAAAPKKVGSKEVTSKEAASKATAPMESGARKSGPKDTVSKAGSANQRSDSPLRPTATKDSSRKEAGPRDVSPLQPNTTRDSSRKEASLRDVSPLQRGPKDTVSKAGSANPRNDSPLRPTATKDSSRKDAKPRDVPTVQAVQQEFVDRSEGGVSAPPSGSLNPNLLYLGEVRSNPPNRSNQPTSVAALSTTPTSPVSPLPGQSQSWGQTSSGSLGAGATATRSAGSLLPSRSAVQPRVSPAPNTSRVAQAQRAPQVGPSRQVSEQSAAGARQPNVPQRQAVSVPGAPRVLPARRS
mmetsp:Transcript_62181/g.165113  ORF Transcript_62181/g.165113 Transcript_62181/m.165113 type:complete len:496 (-) Transcript_62181:79-1566(-)